MDFPIFLQFHKKYIFLLCCRLSLHFYLFHKNRYRRSWCCRSLPHIFHFIFKKKHIIIDVIVHHDISRKKNYFRNPDATVLRNISISMSFLDQRLVIIILLVLNWLLILIFLPLKLVNPLSGFSLLSFTGF